jgi:4-amino-4-deoxy-L-arabinose transferase-like glycosyltransferase
VIRPLVAWRPLGVLAGAVAVALVATSWRYGYHRDELYFIAIGGHPDFGYVDQPPLIPLLAHGLDVAGGHSLVVLRLPSALAGGLIVLVTGLTAREFGAGRGGQLLAAGAMAVSGILLGASHVLSTTTFDLLAWTVLIWLVVRALRDDGPVWLLAGLTAGVALEIKTLPIFLLFALLIAVLAAGPRAALGSRWLWLGALLAVVLWLPNLVWQARNGWPQLQLSSSIAAGNSGSSEPRALFVPMQFLLIAPPLAPVWLIGLWRLARDRRLATWRCLPVAYVVLVVVFVATGGKPYYLCGMYPALLGAGAGPVWQWARTAARRTVIVAAAAVTGAISALVSLPIVPPSALHATPIVAMNYDAGEQVGWPRFADALARAYDALPAGVRSHAVVLTQNYGEAGALLRYRPGLPTYSGHNSMWDLAAPPRSTATVLAVGYDASQLRRWFADVRPVARFDNGEDLDNDEQGDVIWQCESPHRPWARLWPALRHLG